MQAMIPSDLVPAGVALLGLLCAAAADPSQGIAAPVGAGPVSAQAPHAFASRPQALRTAYERIAALIEAAQAVGFPSNADTYARADRPTRSDRCSEPKWPDVTKIDAVVPQVDGKRLGQAARASGKIEEPLRAAAAFHHGNPFERLERAKQHS